MRSVRWSKKFSPSPRIATTARGGTAAMSTSAGLPGGTYVSPCSAANPASPASSAVGAIGTCPSAMTTCPTPDSTVPSSSRTVCVPRPASSTATARHPCPVTVTCGGAERTTRA